MSDFLKSLCVISNDNKNVMYTFHVDDLDKEVFTFCLYKLDGGEPVKQSNEDARMFLKILKRIFVSNVRLDS